ncbi:hypothetical protein [Gordonia soli]|uniref:Uncharacterized protein n=1 Tax=Gordonia soli NBRC 108243 TaxID=1223545 RepID=M0QH39_9ACTN|nr:hypothetical protein [Gordonia soli]GAC67848.1 hypothetical protein GS4_11_01160 [Gordonia soli NBRC 108243]
MTRTGTTADDTRHDPNTNGDVLAGQVLAAAPEADYLEQQVDVPDVQSEEDYPHVSDISGYDV